MATREQAIAANNAAVAEANETIRGLVDDYNTAREACFAAYKAAAEARHTACAAVESTYKTYDPSADVEKIGQDKDFLKPVCVPRFDAGFFSGLSDADFDAVVHDNQAHCWTVQAPAE